MAKLHTLTLGSEGAAKNCAYCGRSFERDKRYTWAYWAKAKYCSRMCFGASWRDAAAARRPPMQEVFDRWVDKSGDCWEWTGARDRDGYGAFSYATVMHRAHVTALELDGRKPANGEYACHTCDNPGCVRPSHLYPGTPSQNSADAVARNRVVRGERQHCAKLRDRDVVEIRKSTLSDTALAAKYGVTPTNINMVRRRRTWKHLP